MEVLHEVEPEMEELEEMQGYEGLSDEDTDEDEGLGELRKLEQALNRVHIAPSPSELPGRKSEADRSELPASYKENSAQEKLLLAMAENFRGQYAHLYPDRKPLLLCPVNECGVQKFVSTTLRPTLLQYPELYHWQGCATFVSDFLSLVLLDPPVDLPKRLNSPTWTLWTQKGTCFDFSTLLCSLLLGTGYNAYCVSGYAVREMCLLNQSRQECPLLTPAVSEESVEQKQEVRKYSVKAPRDLSSRFEQLQEDRKQEESRASVLSKQQEAEKLQEEQNRDPPDPLHGLRVHSWVLVLAGSREVPQNFFIDPLSGLSYPTTSENFLGIESIWNHQNYWVNMQDCRFGSTEMTYDLGDAVKWEYMLWGSTVQSLLLIPDMRKQEEAEEDEEEEAEEPKVFEMPPSWVTKIHISQEDMENCFPGGTKLIQYRKATLEKYSPYLLRDGLVTRLTTYHDLECAQARMVREWYKHRDDHLEQRELNHDTKVTIDHFSPGRNCSLKTHRYVTLVPGMERQMDFYNNARGDGLVSRAETLRDMTETFQNRHDRLCYRQVVYGEAPTHQDRPIQKVVERFHRDRSKPASEDVAERVFLISERRIEVTYHLEDDRIIPAWRNFIKPQTSQFTPQMVSAFQVDPLEKPCKNLFLYETLMALIEEEQNVLKSIQNSESEVNSILQRRQQEEGAVELQISIYDTARNKTTCSRRAELERLAEQERLRDEDRDVDVLAPFLDGLGDPQTVTREQALQLRTDCLSELKQRLIDRANLIQAQIEQETEDLQRKQQWYQQNQPSITKEQEDEYFTVCSNTLFKIHVLKLRLSRHKDQAPQKYLALDEKLRRDPRLAHYVD